MRNFVMFFATLFVAAFAYAIAMYTPVSAAPDDATWDNGSLVWNGRNFSGPQTSDGTNPPDILDGLIYYTSYDQSSSGTTKGYLIYFDTSVTTENIGKATKAQYRTGTYDVASGVFSNLSPPEVISVDSSTYSVANNAPISSSKCEPDGVGWIVCPVSRYIARGMDYLYGVVASFLKVAPVSTDTNGPMYQMWRITLGVANVLFIIAFLILIYAQLSGGMLTNYTIKKMLPRIIVAAVLVNISYWICALAVDISNILGRSVYELMQDVLDKLGAANSAGSKIDFHSINWSSVTAVALSGAGVIGGVMIAGDTALGAGAFSFLIIAALIPALFAVFVAVAVLAARQALIVIFVVISPLAFVAYLLPNTEEWFTRWRKLFISMLVMFPAFSLIFSGAQIAGVLIIQTAQTLPVVVLGLVVQVVPLFITPFLIKLSSGLLSTITGHINDRSKGMFDRAQNWANANKDLHRERAIRNGMKRRSENSVKAMKDLNWRKGNRLRSGLKAGRMIGNNLRPTSTGAYLGTRDQHREKMMAAYKAQSEASYGRTKSGQRSYDEGRFGEDYQAASKAHNEETFQKRITGQSPAPRNVVRRSDPRYAGHQHELHESHRAHESAEIIKKGIEAEGERHFRESIDTAAAGTYEARLRERQIKTVKDTGLAEEAKKHVEAQGNLALRRTVEGSVGFRTRAIETHQFEKQAEEYNTIVQKAAEAAYDNYSRTNQAAQDLRLRAVVETDRAKHAEQQWTTVVEEARAEGYTSPSVAPANSVLADELQYLHRQQMAEEKRAENAQVVQRRHMVEAYASDPGLRTYVGGVDGERGATRIYAQATKELIDESVKEVMTNRALTSKLTRNQLKTMLYDGLDEDGNRVTTEMQQAAMYELLQEKGNNQDAQEIRDAITKKALHYDEARGAYFEFKRDANGRVERDPNTHQPIIDYSAEVDGDIAGNRRDWQQFFDDAAKSSPHNIGTYSGTNRSEAKSGALVDDTRYGFVRDALGGKFGPEKMLKADIDELMTLREDMDNPNGEYQRLDPEAQAKFHRALENAITGLQTHPSYKGQIDDRNRGMMNNILAKANPAYRTGRVDSYGNPVFDVREDKSIVPAGSSDAQDTFTAPTRIDRPIYTSHEITDI